MGKKFKVLVSIFLFCLLSQGVWALVFTARESAFTIDLPSSWEKVESPSDYLSLKNKSGATMRFVIIEDCFDRQCLEEIIDKEIKNLTKRNFKIINNGYTGEAVSETEFTTGDPFLSFDFTKQDMLFTAGYFLSGGKAYNVGVRGVPDTEAHYLLSFISPSPKEEVAEFQDDLQGNSASKLEAVEQSDLTEAENPNTLKEKPKIQTRTQQNPKLNLAHKKLNFIALILLLYFILWCGAFLFKTFFPSKILQQATNPNSPYPLQGKRLYGSPDLFLRLHDNLGNHYIATCSRWGDLLVLSGLGAVLFFSLLRFVFAVLASKEQGPSLLINVFYSLSYLFSACGGIIFLAGFVLNVVFPRKFLFYDSQGELLYKCVQKGFSFFYEQYFIVQQEGHIICKLTRKKFSILRIWKIFDSDKEIAEIKEQSIAKSLFRRIFGHLFGFFRTNYLIKAQMDSSGEIKSISKPATHFSVLLDKPQALPADIMLVFGAVLFMRDRDKSFPWLN